MRHGADLIRRSDASGGTPWLAGLSVLALTIATTSALAQAPQAPGVAAPAVAAPVEVVPGPGAENAKRVPLTRETAERRRAAFEEGWPKLEAALKRWRSLDQGPRDFRRVAPAADIKSYVFSREARESLESRLAEARRQFDGGDWPGAILLYTLLVADANEVVQRLRAVVGYWIWYDTQERRMKRWRRTVRTNQIADSATQALDALEAQVKEHIRAGDFGTAAASLMRQSDELFKSTVAQARASAPGGILRDDPLRQIPKTPCADAEVDRPLAPGSMVLTAPRVDVKRSGNLDGYYPIVARYNNIEGVTRVRTLIAASGCAVYAEVETSSGSELLDDAAMQWTVDSAAFNPAMDSTGAPVAVVLQFNIRFKLYD